MIPISFYLYLSFWMFFIGALTVVVRKNAIVMLIGIELMLNAVNLSFVAFSAMHGDVGGQIPVFFIMVIAAAESGVGLAIIISLFRANKSINVSEASLLQK